MSGLPSAAAAIVASYVLGSVPFGLLLSLYVRGVDLRREGSGNVGATNVGRVLGKRWFGPALLLDAAKGAAAALFVAPRADVPDNWMHLLQAACGGAAVAGHVFSVFLRFRGGKGVATAAGVLAALAPVPLLGALVVFVATALISGYVSLASVLAAVAIPLLAWWSESPTEILWFAGTVAVVIVIRHHSNLYRIAKGAEPRLRRRRVRAQEDEPRV